MKKLMIVATIAIAIAIIADIYTSLSDIWLMVIILVPIILTYFFLEEQEKENALKRTLSSQEDFNTKLSESIKDACSNIQECVKNIPDYTTNFQSLSSLITNEMEKFGKKAKERELNNVAAFKEIIDKKVASLLMQNLQTANDVANKNNEILRDAIAKGMTDVKLGIQRIPNYKEDLKGLSMEITESIKKENATIEQNTKDRDAVLRRLIDERLTSLKDQLLTTNENLDKSLQSLDGVSTNLKDQSMEVIESLKKENATIEQNTKNRDAVLRKLIGDQIFVLRNQLQTTDEKLEKSLLFIDSVNANISTTLSNITNICVQYINDLTKKFEDIVEENKLNYQLYDDKASDVIKNLGRKVSEINDMMEEVFDKIKEDIIKELEYKIQDLEEPIITFKEHIDSIRIAEKELDKSEKESLDKLEKLLNLSSKENYQLEKEKPVSNNTNGFNKETYNGYKNLYKKKKK